ncbi:Sec7 domain-containing protein [Candidatus Tisiphia endosymbiont of Metellina segmentata]|uniref:Sec7 domain-containing protein n=1 Tax=Candidatus Tisiphia endosymbiont of Metellina segmentata TaxID=3066274 RepID=UPI00313B8119
MSKNNKLSNSHYESTNSIDSGYESDTQDRIHNENLQKVLENFITSFRTGMHYMKGYISDELIKIAANNNGIIDINNPQFKEACKTLLEADPTVNSGAYSVSAEVKGIEEKIDKVIIGKPPEQMGINESYFAEFRQELQNYKESMHKQLSSNEGINQLIDQRLINNNIFRHLNLYELGNDNQPQALMPQDKIIFLSKITSYIQNIPQELRREIIFSIKSGKNPTLDNLINDAVISAFATYGDETKTWGMLDKQKITEENIKNFSECINQIIKTENTKLVTQKFFDEAIQNIKLNNKDIIITPSQKEKIYKKLSPELIALNPDQFTDTPKQLISEIANKIITMHKGIEAIAAEKILIIRQFNIKPKSGIDILQQVCEKHGLNISKELSNLFIEEKNQLNLEYIGDYLGTAGQVNTNTLKSFVEQLDFKEKPFIAALREYLKAFKLPGEAQKIDRLVEVFGQKYCNDNQKHDIYGQDAAYLLAFQAIILNSDLHNPSVKTKMTLEQLKKNLNGTNNGHNFPAHLLEEIYKDIKENPFELNFVETVPGYTFKSNNLNNDPTFIEINNILSNNKAVGNFIRNLIEVKIDQPKTWLSDIIGYQGNITVKNQEGAKATMQLYKPNVFSYWFLGEKSKVIIQPGHKKDQLDNKNIELAAQLAAEFRTVKVTEKDIGAGYDYLIEDLYKAYKIAKGKEEGKFPTILDSVNNELSKVIMPPLKPIAGKEDFQLQHVQNLKRSNAGLDAQDSLMTAIREGVNLKKVRDRNLSDVSYNSQTGNTFIDELQKRLKARSEKLGEGQVAVGPAKKYSEEAKLFEQASKEEAERQARIEKSENVRVAAALAAAGKAENLEIKPKSTPLNLKSEGIPPPPPPPPPPLPIFQLNNVDVKPRPIGVKQNQQNKGTQRFNIDQEAIKNIKSRLKSSNALNVSSKKEEVSPQVDFRGVLKKKLNRNKPVGRG